MKFKIGDRVTANTAHLTADTDYDNWKDIPHGTPGIIDHHTPNPYTKPTIQPKYFVRFKSGSNYYMPENCLTHPDPFHARIAHKAKTTELFI